MNKLKEAAEKVLEAYDKNSMGETLPFRDYMEALHAALAEPEPEPVAWLYDGKEHGGVQAFTQEPPPSLKARCQPLYTRQTP